MTVTRVVLGWLLALAVLAVAMWPVLAVITPP
jgi:nitrate reductase NapE component